MALFTDGPVSIMEDLTAQDTQLPGVASVEGIDVTQKLFLAREEVGLELETLIEGPRQGDQAVWLAPKATIKNVVATPALKLWHTFRTLEMVYRDAYSDQLNDRYAAKRDQFKDRAKWAYEKLLLLGIGIVRSPVPRAKEPQALSEPGSLPDDTYYVAMAWINNKGEEGMPSVAAAITTAGSTFVAQPGTPPACATGWNIYAGADPEALSRQNESPIAAAQAWIQPDTLATAGSAPGWGQSPDYLMAVPRMILRG